MAAFNGGKITLDQISVNGIFWSGLYTMGNGSITVGDNAYVNTYQANGTYQSYGIRE